MKRLEGRSEKTLFLYKFNIGKILEKTDKNVCVMNTGDIRKYSTGMRVGEPVKLDIADMDFEEREYVVLGKGDRERIVYFDAKTKLHLEK